MTPAYRPVYANEHKGLEAHKETGQMSTAPSRWPRRRPEAAVDHAKRGAASGM